MQYRIKNWEKFQHYKSGRGAPPWIKLYRELLNDKEWFALPPEAAKILVSLWILAAEADGELPDIETIAFRLRVDSKVLAENINHCSHWLIQDASSVLADRYQVATPETETETETEEELTANAVMSGKPSALPDASSLSSQKNGQHYNRQAREVLEFLNAKTDRHYQPVDANIRLIVARLKEGASVADCRAVVAKKCREWSTDEKMSDYLRPATLFNATKFAQYRGELTEVQND